MLKKTVVEYFISNHRRILRGGGLNIPTPKPENIFLIGEVLFHQSDEDKNNRNFSARFRLEEYEINFFGTINLTKVIRNEAFSGKKLS